MVARLMAGVDMSGEPKIEFSRLEAGDEFPASCYKLDHSTVSFYLKAVEDSSSLYQATDLVPPMVVAAYALQALAEDMALPPGTIHVSQELEFNDTVSLNDNLVSHVRVSRKQTRGKLHLLTMALNVSNQNQKIVLVGETSFMLPVSDQSEGL